jgi:hypothetical protein
MPDSQHPHIPGVGHELKQPQAKAPAMAYGLWCAMMRYVGGSLRRHMPDLMASTGASCRAESDDCRVSGPVGLTRVWG